MKKNKIKRRNRGNLYIFDPITTEIKQVDYDYMEELTGLKAVRLSVYKTKRKPLYIAGVYFLHEGLTRKEYSELMAKWKSSEVKEEVWKDLPGGRTQVSSLGRFRNLHRDGSYRYLMVSQRGSGGMWVKVFINDRYEYQLANRLVAKYFVMNNRPEATKVYHKNGIKRDNRAANLAWVTHPEISLIGGQAKRNYIAQICTSTGETVEVYNTLTDVIKKNKYLNRDMIRKALNGDESLLLTKEFRWERRDTPF